VVRGGLIVNFRSRVLLVAYALAIPAFASDGVVEINHTCATTTGCTPSDVGGYPVTIGTRGSYELTSDLVVPPNLNGIDLAADDVHLDLNGFAIRGPATCAPIICNAGTGSGVSPLNALFFGARVTLVDGTVSGFAADCVNLRDTARVERLMVRQCGGDGIEVGGRSLVIGNRVLETRGDGLKLNGSLFQNNAIDSNGYGAIGGTGGVSVMGGRATGGNFCGDGRCTRADAKRYYLTQTFVDGAHPLTECGAGFHMASLWEIHDPSGHVYDLDLGSTSPDSGQGPPAREMGEGWVRTGDYLNSYDEPGRANCYAWSQTTGFGTIAELNAVVGSPTGAPDPWQITSVGCLTLHQVWCVEN
jgi:hypothetical protein